MVTLALFLLFLLFALLFAKIDFWLGQHTESVINESRMESGHGEAGVLAIKKDRKERAYTCKALIDLIETSLNHLKLLTTLL